MRKINLYLKYVTLVCLLLSGCGGGSRGTETQTVQGKVVNQAGLGVPNVEVVADSTGDSAVSAENGEFSFETADLFGEEAVTIRGKGFEITTTLGDVPRDTIVTTILFTLLIMDDGSIAPSISDIRYTLADGTVILGSQRKEIF